MKPKKKGAVDRLQPQSFNQENLILALEVEPAENGDDAFVIATGYAGTGKTYVATMIGAEQYVDRAYNQIVIIKPTVGPDSNGFLPGTEEEKMAPWIATVSEPLKAFFGPEQWQRKFGTEVIVASLEFIRGKTFDNSYIIVDEAQNLTISQMKVVLTRIGQNSKMVFCGDTRQCDLPKKEQSGLEWFVDACRARRERGIEIIDFGKEDCVRSGACKKALHIIESAYD